jgi:two-component system response regulator FixJ
MTSYPSFSVAEPAPRPKQGLSIPTADKVDQSANSSAPLDGWNPHAEAAEVVLIDDDPAVLQGLLLVFADDGLSPVGFSDPLDALMWASDADPTCIIVDLKLPGIDGLDLVAALCAVGRHCIILMSAYIDIDMTVEAMRLGVDNVLQKPTDPEKMVAAARRGIARLASIPRQEIITFTRRERQVAEHLVVGRTTKQIAQSLSLSPRTVEFFRASLLRKTRSPNTAALASALTRIGFAVPDAGR